MYKMVLFLIVSLTCLGNEILNLDSSFFQHGTSKQIETYIKNNNINLNKILTNNGVNNGLNIFTIACINSDKEEKIDMLIRNGGLVQTSLKENKSPLTFVAMNGKFPHIITKLVKSGADVNHKDNKGITPLIYAAAHNQNHNFIKLLIANGADIHATDINQVNALMYAAISNNKIVIKELITSGLDPNSVDKNNSTPIMYAIFHKNLSVARELIKHDININHENNYNINVLTYAILMKLPHDFINILIKNGAKPNYFPDGKTSIIDIAIENKNDTQTIKLLKKYFQN